MGNTVGTDWPGIITALSVLAGTLAPIYFKLRKLGKKVDVNNDLANGNLTAANKRIEQLTRELSNYGHTVPPSQTKEDNQ